MTTTATITPVTCFGQQPCGFFPRRYLYAKIVSARRLQSEIGGEVVFFCHDSDHDFRETRTTLRHRKTGEPLQLNFAFDNQVQRKFSPLYLKRVRADWRARTADQIRPYVGPRWADEFRAVEATNVADFCLEMYRRMGLLDDIRVVRSSDPTFRRTACDIDDYFVDVPYESEVVRARLVEGRPRLYKEATSPWTSPTWRTPASQISPAGDTRLPLDAIGDPVHALCCRQQREGLPSEGRRAEITYVVRDTIERADEAYVEPPT